MGVDRPSRTVSPGLLLCLPQPVNAPRQAIASAHMRLRWTWRGAMRARSLRKGPVARRFERLVAGYRGVRERLVGLLLEDLAQPSQGDRQLPLEPRARAEPLLDAIPLDAGLGPGGHRQLRRAVVVGQLPLGPAGRTPQPADPAPLDDRARRVDLDDLVLGPLREQRRVDEERRPCSDAD